MWAAVGARRGAGAGARAVPAESRRAPDMVDWPHFPRRAAHPRSSRGQALAGKCSGPIRFGARHLLDEIDDAAAQLGARNAHEGFHQRQAVTRRKEVGDRGRRRRFTQSGQLARRRRRAFKEERRHLEDQCDLLQAACADAVRALFVFLHLPIMSDRAHRRAFPDSSRASCAACERGWRHACRSDSAPSLACGPPLELARTTSCMRSEKAKAGLTGRAPDAPRFRDRIIPLGLTVK